MIKIRIVHRDEGGDSDYTPDTLIQELEEQENLEPIEDTEEEEKEPQEA